MKTFTTTVHGWGVVVAPAQSEQYKPNAIYVSAQKHAQYPGCDYIEFVRAGFCQYSLVVHTAQAPEAIIEIVRKEFP